MPRKNVLERYQAITNGDMSASIISPVTSCKFLDNIFIELVATGTPNGTYYVEASNDYQIDIDGNVLNAGTWVPLPIVESTAINGAANIVFDINQLSAPFIRMHFVRTGGTGTLQMYISAKEI